MNTGAIISSAWPVHCFLRPPDFQLVTSSNYTHSARNRLSYFHHSYPELLEIILVPKVLKIIFLLVDLKTFLLGSCFKLAVSKWVKGVDEGIVILASRAYHIIRLHENLVQHPSNHISILTCQSDYQPVLPDIGVFDLFLPCKYSSGHSLRLHHIQWL